MSIPVVKHDDKGIPTLYVHDQPFFMRSGDELRDCCGVLGTD